MKHGIFFLLLSVFAFAGCGSTAGKVNNLETEVGVLKARINSMEQRQTALEGQTRGSDEAVGYLKGKVDSRNPSTVIINGESSGKEGIAHSGKVSTHKDVQRALKNAGFYNGPVDGKIGKSTIRAIKEFQKTNNLKVTGTPGTTTKKLLQQYL